MKENTRTQEAIDWWLNLETKKKDILFYNFCTGHQISPLEFEIEHIEEIYCNEHGILLQDSEKFVNPYQKELDEIDDKMNKFLY